MEWFQEFDFSTWAALAKSDPETFEQARREALERQIQSACNDINRQRLKVLDREIEANRTTQCHPAANLDYMISTINGAVELRLLPLLSKIQAMLGEEPQSSIEGPKAMCLNGPFNMM